MGSDTVSLCALDGTDIEAELVRFIDGPARGTLVIGHPHPLHGGDRHNHVVRALQQAAARCGLHSIAPNFRGVGNSGGTHDGGDAERLDLAAACELAELIEPDHPVIMSGYSFGALVALNVTHPAVAGWLAVAPPLRLSGSAPLASRDHRPKVILSPEHDQFSPPADVRAAVGTWVNADLTVMAGVDHFIAADAPHWCTRALDTLIAHL